MVSIESSEYVHLGGVRGILLETMCLAIPYRLTQISGPGRALAEGPDGVRDVSTLLLESPRPGTYVLVAYGSAIREIEPGEAAELLEILKALQDAASSPQ